MKRGRRGRMEMRTRMDRVEGKTEKIKRRNEKRKIGIK
jgi:hypothetical protein